MLDQSDKNRFRSELFRVTQILTIELRFPPEFSGLIPLSFHNPWSQIYNHKRKPSFPTTYRCMLWAQSKCVWLTLCNPTDCNPPASSVHRIFRQEHWSGLPLPSPWSTVNVQFSYLLIFIKLHFLVRSNSFSRVLVKNNCPWYLSSNA